MLVYDKEWRKDCRRGAVDELWGRVLRVCALCGHQWQKIPRDMGVARELVVMGDQLSPQPSPLCRGCQWGEAPT